MNDVIHYWTQTNSTPVAISQLIAYLGIALLCVGLGWALRGARKK